MECPERTQRRRVYFRCISLPAPHAKRDRGRPLSPSVYRKAAAISSFVSRTYSESSRIRSLSIRMIGTEMLKAYLAAIVRNKAKTALRKHHEEEPLEDDLLQISIPNQPEQKILLSELREIAHEAVDSLGEPDREIFQRYYFFYQKTEDISKALGLKDATVRAKLARGRKRLKDYLTERGFSCEDTHY